MRNEINMIRNNIEEMTTTATKKENKRELIQNLKRDINNVLISLLYNLSDDAEKLPSLSTILKSKYDIIEKTFSIIRAKKVKAFKNYYTEKLGTTTSNFTYVLKYESLSDDEILELIEKLLSEKIAEIKRELKAVKDDLANDIIKSLYDSFIENVARYKKKSPIYNALQSSTTIKKYESEIYRLYGDVDVDLFNKCYNKALSMIRFLYRKDIQDEIRAEKENQKRLIKKRAFNLGIMALIYRHSKKLKKVRRTP